MYELTEQGEIGSMEVGLTLVGEGEDERRNVTLRQERCQVTANVCCRSGLLIAESDKNQTGASSRKTPLLDRGCGISHNNGMGMVPLGLGGN